MPRLEVAANQFWFDGQPLQIISGALHYFRVVPDYWRDRLLKLKACGFNTVETYIPWNLHEPVKGEFDFEGLADVERFILTAGELGLHVIVRPSPYICAEWTFGGLPAWLLADPDIRLRCYDHAYLRHVDGYYDVLLPKLKPLQSTHGGPIIAMQIENEYGSYGNDKRYLHYLKRALVGRGIIVLLFTSDGPTDTCLQGGMLEGTLATVNFGSHPQDAFALLKKYQPDGPLMCMEFWNGWFDHWGERHHRRDSADVAQVLDEMLSVGASVNFYMFHGGTNFGFSNGANLQEVYEPTITSYDYDVLLNEAGEPMDKFYAVRDVLERHQGSFDTTLPAPIKKRAYGDVELAVGLSLQDALPMLAKPIQRTCPEPMEKLGQNDGFILYATQVSGPRETCDLWIQDVHDRALVFLDGVYQGVLERWHPERLKLHIPAGGARLSLLVENMGRVNYGSHLHDPKGITTGVRLNNQFLFDWILYPLPLDNTHQLDFTTLPITKGWNGPTFYRGQFHVDEACDTFLDVAGWQKGVVFVNGFHLGRYWDRGPQKTLYVPGPILKVGTNEMVVFELHGRVRSTMTLSDEHILG